MCVGGWSVARGPASVTPGFTADLPPAPLPQIEQGGAAGSSQVDSLNVSVATGILLHRLLTAQAPVGAGGGGAAATAAEA